MEVVVGCSDMWFTSARHIFVQRNSFLYVYVYTVVTLISISISSLLWRVHNVAKSDC